MRARARQMILIAAVTGMIGGCATSQEWADWRSHPSHFASGQHLVFSVRNTEGAAPRVRRTDVAAARDEAWWGKAVTVNTDQIFQN